jgi:DNA modification methylase
MADLVADFTQPGQIILDPFMGSGTTGIGCLKLGRAFIGIERDENHFATACERIRKAYAQPDMFIAPREPAPVQQPLFGGEAA